jgi:hypothetical protein
MITPVYANAKAVRVFCENAHCLGGAPSAIPGDESDFRKKVVELHLLQESFVVEAAVLGSKQGVVYDEAGQGASLGIRSRCDHRGFNPFWNSS